MVSELFAPTTNFNELCLKRLKLPSVKPRVLSLARRNGREVRHFVIRTLQKDCSGQLPCVNMSKTRPNPLISMSIAKEALAMGKGEFQKKFANIVSAHRCGTRLLGKPREFVLLPVVSLKSTGSSRTSPRFR